jgi:hypothetical protein
VADFGGQTQMVVKMVVRPIANLSEERPLPRMTQPSSLLRRRASDQYWQQTLCRDVVPRRCIQGASGLAISRRSRARDRCLKSGHRAIDMDQPMVGSPVTRRTDRGHRAAALRVSSRAARYDTSGRRTPTGLTNAKNTEQGLEPTARWATHMLSGKLVS